MWLIKDIGYLGVFVALCLAIILPPLTWWERRFNAVQAALERSDPAAFERQRYRAVQRFDRVDLTVTVIGVVAAFVILRRCMEWWGG